MAPLRWIEPDELSYVSASDPLWKRALMRGIENASGRLRLLPIYREWRATVPASDPRRWGRLLGLVGTTLNVVAKPGWELQVPPGPLVMIANHPFGIADGVAMLALAERVGRPYRILLHKDLMRIPEAAEIGLPIDFSGTRAALEANLATRTRARELALQGTTIIVFPAGGVATAETPFGTAEDLVWKQFVVRLIRQSNANVLPVHIEGQNSPLFHFVSRFSLTLRLSLIPSEARRQIGAQIRVAVGEPISCRELIGAAAKERLLDELYVRVHRLAPGAAEADRELLLPRPPDVRRPLPWDDTAEVGGKAKGRP